MSRRFDTRTTVFSPEGRLYQVEYAMEAISHAGTCLGILASDGVLLACERRNVNKLLDDSVFKSEKLYKVNDDIMCSVAGITADANVLINQLRIIAQQHRFQYGEQIPLELLVRSLCDTKQAYTQFGGMRPFGVSLVYAGWDKELGFQLYLSDPSGNYSGWKATCVGNNSSTAINVLKQEFDENNTDLASAMKLAVKIMAKTMDATKLTADNVELVTLSQTNGKVRARLVDSLVLTKLITEHEAEEKRIEEEKAAKEREAKKKGSSK